MADSNAKTAMTFSLNSFVGFQPTAEGLQHYRQKRVIEAEQIKLPKGQIFPLDLDVDHRGYAELQLHEFMFYFGDVFTVGMTDDFISNNEIQILTKDLKQSEQ